MAEAATMLWQSAAQSEADKMSRIRGVSGEGPAFGFGLMQVKTLRDSQYMPHGHVLMHRHCIGGTIKSKAIKDETLWLTILE